MTCICTGWYPADRWVIGVCRTYSHLSYETGNFNRCLLAHEADLTKTLELINDYKNFFLTKK
jgi:hypothetical protein